MHVAAPSRFPTTARVGTRRYARPIPILAAALAVAATMAGPAAVGRAASTGSEPHAGSVSINEDGYTSAQVCGRCHTDIYESWKRSLHAFSLTDPIFDAAYMMALKEAGDDAKSLCLRCHAPMTMTNRDYELVQGVTREGVSCDFCHTVSGLAPAGADVPYLFDVGPIKRSILRKAASPAHDVAFSELHGTAEFCAGCHNYVAPGGAAIMSTYDEWREGPYAEEGKPCQTCHMVLGEGRVVSEEVKASQADMHLHDLIHDSNQLRDAMSVEIIGATRTGDDVDVRVRVANVGSGHKVPTGMPSREVVLTVTAEVDGLTTEQERRYRKVIADADGNIIDTDWEAILYGAKVVSDNRVAPRGEQVERFRFYVRQRRPVNISAELSYRYRPVIMETQHLDIELSRATETVR